MVPFQWGSVIEDKSHYIYHTITYKKVVILTILSNHHCKGKQPTPNPTSHVNLGCVTRRASPDAESPNASVDVSCVRLRRKHACNMYRILASMFAIITRSHTDQLCGTILPSFHVAIDASIIVRSDSVERSVDSTSGFKYWRHLKFSWSHPVFHLYNEAFLKVLRSLVLKELIGDSSISRWNDASPHSKKISRIDSVWWKRGT